MRREGQDIKPSRGSHSEKALAHGSEWAGPYLILQRLPSASIRPSTCRMTHPLARICLGTFSRCYKISAAQSPANRSRPSQSGPVMDTGDTGTNR